MFKITFRGNAHIYETIEEANKVAEEIFHKAGIIVGIEKIALNGLNETV